MNGVLKWLSFALAIWGAFLSTVLAIRTFWADRRQLLVTCAQAIAALPIGGTADLFIITVVNVGKRPVEVRAAGFLTSDGGMYTQAVSTLGHNPFGQRLADGESADFRFDLDQMKSAAGRVRFTRAIVRDAEGRQYTADLPRGFETAVSPTPNLEK